MIIFSGSVLFIVDGHAFQMHLEAKTPLYKMQSCKEVASLSFIDIAKSFSCHCLIILCLQLFLCETLLKDSGNKYFWRTMIGWL